MTAALSHRQILRVVVTAIAVAMALLSHLGDRFRHAGSHPVPRHASAVCDDAGISDLPRHDACRMTGRPTRSSTPTTGCRRSFDYCCSSLRRAPILYLFVNYEYVVTRIYYIDDLSWTDMALGVL